MDELFFKHYRRILYKIKKQKIELFGVENETYKKPLILQKVIGCVALRKRKMQKEDWQIIEHLKGVHREENNKQIKDKEKGWW